jgi:ubiquinone/menaquinone biosynthesis C-methylase UbiE
VSCAGFGNLTPTASLILAPHGRFAQQGWLCGARQWSNHLCRIPSDTVILFFFEMSENTSTLKDRVRAFWQENPCGTKFADAPPGSRRFYELVEEHRYTKEWHIPIAAEFAKATNLKVLEVGCGLGTDGAQFAKAGAIYTGIDLTEAAVDLARRRFELFQLPGTFRVADAERLDFPDNTFDIVYSHGVLHHTPDTAAAVHEVHRVLRPGGKAVVMLYHRDSYNYRVNISLLRRTGVQLLRWRAGVKLVHFLTREPEESLREHARQLRTQSEYLNSEEFLSRNTDGAGNPLARVYSRSDARELFNDFAHVELRTYFLNKRWLPLLGPILPRSLESQVASRWGWHLWIYATKHL